MFSLVVSFADSFNACPWFAHISFNFVEVFGHQPNNFDGVVLVHTVASVNCLLFNVQKMPRVAGSKRYEVLQCFVGRLDGKQAHHDRGPRC